MQRLRGQPCAYRRDLTGQGSSHPVESAPQVTTWRDLRFNRAEDQVDNLAVARAGFTHRPDRYVARLS